jgi:hypothetical protein
MDKCYMAVNKETMQFFGGKKQRTHIGYPKLNFLKSAMTNAKVSKDDYYFAVLSFDERGMPTLNKVEEEI